MITPIFPLPSILFYPHNLLPLHVFEPRYLELTEDALGGNKMIAMVQLKPNWEADYEGAPPVYETATLGRIVHHEKLANGRYNIVLLGMERLRVTGEVAQNGKGYRCVDAEIVETQVDHAGRRLADAQERLLAQCHKLVELRPIYKRWLDRVMSTYEQPDIFSDLVAGFLASSFDIGSYEGLSILEEPFVSRRLQLISVQAQRIIGELIEGAI